MDFVTDVMKKRLDKQKKNLLVRFEHLMHLENEDEITSDEDPNVNVCNSA